MSIVVPFSTKGGAGKSTLAAHLAIAAVGFGRKVFVGDCDTGQTSLHVWARAARSNRPAPTFQKCDEDSLDERLAWAREQNYDLAILDVRAGGGEFVSRIISMSHHVLIPVKASTFDLAATKQTIEMAKRTGDDSHPVEIALNRVIGKSLIVLNTIPSKPSAKWREDLEGALLQCGAGGLTRAGELGDRVAFRTTLEKGMGVTEDGRDEKAIAEITQVYEALRARELERAEKLQSLRVQG